jgi:hypothetical protein
MLLPVKKEGRPRRRTMELHSGLSGVSKFIEPLALTEGDVRAQARLGSVDKFDPVSRGGKI